MNKEKRSVHLKSELQKIDQCANPNIPSQKELLDQLAQMKAERRKSLLKEVMLFMFFALSMVSAAMLAFHQVPVVFVVLQVCALAVLPVLIAAEKKRYLGEREVKR
ncbi:YxlC family protein [Bacillus vallismortis]|uniref:YxlC family protein n=1 Tax=Bacillus vallismortis TaxID=72361 RepID=UPI00228133A2|nr:YxlC family protein [Bacillus vallismortis]MCY8534103.1 YxlC family protein [Bacillus vallismortis]MCY8545668.1 YxlC family protein [Bacillus vallismortis]